MSSLINIQSDCLDSKTIIANGGSVVENLDGSVSVYTSENVPEVLGKLCCETLSSKYFFDIDTQICKWSDTPVNTTCSLNDTFKVVLNPTGNDGSMFIVEPNDNCSLTINFDYLFKVKCETLVDILSVQPISGCSTPISVIETLDVSVTIDIVTTANTLETVFEYNLFPAIGLGNLYTYLTTHTNSGLYICGNETPSGCTALSLNISGITSANTYSCESVLNSLVQDLYIESGLSGITGGADTFTNTIIPSALASQWLHYSSVVTDPAILALINNKKIKLTLKINNTCSDICILVDELVLDKTCTRIEKTNIFLSQSPGFELDRIRDNKKSWVGNASPVNRNFKITNNKGGNLIRQTNYDVNDERLVINTKEIDLDISLASAIETDVWCYLVDNPCLLTGTTTCNPCIAHVICGNKSFQDDECFYFMDGEVYNFMDGDFNVDSLNLGDTCCGDNKINFTSLLTQPLSGITTVEDFEYFMTSELIDAKNRKTLSGYPTLRALYDRYMNSGLYCGNNSSKFDYLTIDQFAGLVGNYWVDIVEQVIPATTIWGSVKIYSNTIFDQQKFKYKAYSSLFCDNPFTGKTISNPINGTNGECADVEVIMTSLSVSTGETLNIAKVQTVTCNKLCLAQMNMGSEFIGNVTIIGSEPVVPQVVIGPPPVIIPPIVPPPPPPPPISCVVSADCPPGYWCIAGTCVPSI
jgi:hypothetical protein